MGGRVDAQVIIQTGGSTGAACDATGGSTAPTCGWFKDATGADIPCAADLPSDA